MNKKVNLLLTSFTALVVLFLVSCGGKSEGKSETASNDGPLVGDWTVVKAEGIAAEANKGQVYEFKGDGSAKVSYSDYTYTLEKDTLKMDYEGQGQIVLVWKCTIDGNKLTLDNATDADQTLWLEKK